MEAFSKLFSISVQRGFLSGFSVGSRSTGVINVSHLLFADDTLVFCGASPDHLLYLRMLLLSFEAVSSLKINLDKSVLALWVLWIIWMILLAFWVVESRLFL
jgi:hypothetical protein